jgi:hypothetical protein
VPVCDHSAAAKAQPPMPQPGEAAGVAELDVNVEYDAGCARSHAARLAVPVMPPFRRAPSWVSKTHAARHR